MSNFSSNYRLLVTGYPVAIPSGCYGASWLQVTGYWLLTTMRIGIDCRTILNPGYGEQAGVGHYTYFLVKHLLELDQENEYVLFFDRRFPESTAHELVGNRTKTILRFFPFHEYRHFMPVIYSHLLVTSFIARERCDLFHSPSGHLPYRYTAPSVITIHDLAIFKHPEWFPESVLARFSSTRILLPRSVKLARRIIVPSEATALDLRQFFSPLSLKGEEEGVDKIRIIPHGLIPPDSHSALPELDDLRARYNISGRYLLFVGTIEPRKNVRGLIRAFRKAFSPSKDGEGVVLVIAGARGWKYDEAFAEMKSAGSIVRYLGYVPAHDKFALMKYATAFIFPSLYEGFGFPVLEAMSMGTPVITSNISSLPEVVGDAAVLVDPYDEANLEEAMRRILTDDGLRQKLISAGRSRAAQFSWMKTAERTLEVYQEAFRI